MKKQYLGDVGDLFKYDLIQWILEGISSLQGLTYIPMLTEYDRKTGDGNKRDFDKAKRSGRPGTENDKLKECLKKYTEIDRPEERDFTRVRKYFESNGFEMRIWKENEFLERKYRADYFDKIEKCLLPNSLILVDPDTGLEIKNSTEKHFLYSEVEDLHNAMDEDSIMMIYQQFPRARRTHKKYLPAGRSKKLKNTIGYLPLYISDNELFFLFLAKSSKLKSKIEGIINRYKRDYPNRIRLLGDKS